MKPVYQDVDMHRDIRTSRTELTAVTDFVRRAVNVSTAVLTVPMCLHYLGQDQFEVWILLSTVWLYMITADCGIGIGLKQYLIAHFSHDDHLLPGVFVSSAFFCLSAVGAAIILLVFFFGHDLSSLVLAGNETFDGAFRTLLVVFGLLLPFSTVEHILVAYQRGYLFNVLSIAGRICGFCALVVALHTGVSLPGIVGIYFSCPLVFMMMGQIWLWFRVPRFRVRMAHVSVVAAGKMLRIGGLVFVQRLCAMIVTVYPLALIARTYAEPAITNGVGVTIRLLGLLSVMTMPISMSVWPAYGEALHRNDRAWIRKAFVTVLLFVTISSVLFFAGGLVLGQQVIRLWTGDERIVPEVSLLVPLLFVTAADSVRYALVGFLSAVGSFRIQTAASVVAACLVCALSTSFIRSWGPAGVYWIVFACGPLFLCLCYAFRVYSLRESFEESIPGASGDLAVAVV